MRRPIKNLKHKNIRLWSLLLTGCTRNTC